MKQITADGVIRRDRVQRARIPESRIAYVNTTRRIILEAVDFNDIPVTVLTGGEEVRYELLDGADVIDTGDATWGIVHRVRENDVLAWSAVVTMPATEMFLDVHWYVTIQGATTRLFDRLEVITP